MPSTSDGTTPHNGDKTPHSADSGRGRACHIQPHTDRKGGSHQIIALVEDEEIRPKLATLAQAKVADTYLTGSIAVEDADGLKIEIDPQHYPFMVKRGGKLELERLVVALALRCPFEKLITISNDLWGQDN